MLRKILTDYAMVVKTLFLLVAIPGLGDAHGKCEPSKWGAEDEIGSATLLLRRVFWLLLN